MVLVLLYKVELISSASVAKQHAFRDGRKATSVYEVLLHTQKLPFSSTFLIVVGLLQLLLLDGYEITDVLAQLHMLYP